MSKATPIAQTSETIYLEPDAMIIASQVASGRYQHRLVAGVARWSGADIRGEASRYAGRYSCSRNSLVHKMRSAGLTVVIVKGQNDKYIAVVSCEPFAMLTEGNRRERTLRIAA